MRRFPFAVLFVALLGSATALHAAGPVRNPIDVAVAAYERGALAQARSAFARLSREGVPAAPPVPPPVRPSPKATTPPGWPAGLVLEPADEDRLIKVEDPPPRPAPHPPAPISHRPTRTQRESTEGQDGPGKFVLWGLGLLLVLIKGCDGCDDRSSRDSRYRRPSPTSPTDTPTRTLQPLSPAEQRRLEELRRNHMNGEPLTPAEGRELLELERRASRARPR